MAAMHSVETIEAVGDALPPGTQLCQGQYTIESYLNAGGFGVTYLALDSLGRKIVIKECYPGVMCHRSQGVVHPRASTYVGDFDRVTDLFQKEARALARLCHPGIVGVHQIFKDNGTVYMALDFIEGPDLLQILDAAPETLDPDEITRILQATLEALAYVHANGILHRDISPDNILLGPDGMPVLIDFGAAREGAARATRILSRVHTVKDGYSPQEFYLGSGSQEKASDLYALAATAYHLVTGAPPPNSTERLAAVAEGRPDPCRPLTGRATGFAPQFLMAVDKCLSIFPKDRLQSAEAWLAMLADGRRGAIALEAGGDALIDTRIAALVEETARALAEDAAAAAAPRIEEGRIDPRLEAEREYWAILNEDPAQIAAERARWEAEQARLRMTRDDEDEDGPAAPRRRNGFSLLGLLVGRRRGGALHP